MRTWMPDFRDFPLLKMADTTRCDSSEIRWYSDWGNLLALALGMYAIGYLVLLALASTFGQSHELVQELGFLVPTLAGILFVVRVARFSRLSREVRRAWKIITVAFVFWLLGDISWAGSSLAGTLAPLESVGSVSYLLAISAVSIGVLMLPVQGLSVTSRRIFWLDASIILVGVAILVGFFVIGVDGLRVGEGSLQALSLFIYTIFYTTAFALLIFVLVRRPLEGAAGAVVFMGVGSMIMTGTNLWWAYSAMRGEVLTGGVAYGFWMVGHLLLVVSPQIHYDIARRSVDLPWLDTAVHRLRALIPYSAAGIGMLVLMVAGISVFIERFGIVIALVVGLIGLIVVRQLTSLRQNERLHAERAIRQTENWYRALVLHSSDLITILDGEYRCRYQSPGAASAITDSDGLSAGRSFLRMVHPEDRHIVQDALERVKIAGTDTAIVEWRLGLSGNEPRYFETIISNRLDDEVVAGLVLNSRDVTDRKRLESQLTQMAFHDPLTTLPNRASFFRMLSRAMEEVDEGRAVALLFVDIDDFKYVNDTYGHDIGDAILQQFSDRLLQSIRPSDLVSRLAGDEFTVMLPDIQDASEARSVAERILERMRHPFQVNDVTLRVSSSVGITLTNDADADKNELLRFADLAMYAAKSVGPGTAAVYEPHSGYRVVVHSL
jgi:diguanylate cyclase (GGDEF)-like protein